MRRHNRTMSGAAIAILALPIFLGLLACLPVPVGNPEKSRIDPDLNGVWISPAEDGEGALIVLLEPYDKRTWLWSSYSVSPDSIECDFEEQAAADDDSDYEKFVAAVIEFGTDCFKPDGFQMYKTWQTRLGKHHFLTHEIKGLYDDKTEFFAGAWFAYRIDKRDADHFALRLIDGGYDGFDEIEAFDVKVGSLAQTDPKQHRKMKRSVEKVIRRNAEDDALYDGDPLPLVRVLPEHVEDILETIEDAGPNFGL